MSSVYWPLPVIKRRSSLRRTAAPIPVALMAVLLETFSSTSRTLHGARAGSNRLDDVVIAGAAAEIAVEFMTDGFFIQFIALAPDHVDRGHHHARRAKSALQPVVLAEGFLHGRSEERRVGKECRSRWS